MSKVWCEAPLRQRIYLRRRISQVNTKFCLQLFPKQEQQKHSLDVH